MDKNVTSIKEKKEQHGMEMNNVLHIDTSMEKNLFLIKNVSKEVSLTTTWELKYSKSFLELEENSNELFIKSLRLLEGDKLSLVEKQIIIFAIQNIDFSEYKYFLRDLAKSYKNGKIDECIVECSFYPDGWNNRIIKNYKDPIIKEALSICLNNNQISNNFKKMIKKTLNGNLWKNYQKRINIEIKGDEK